MGEEDTPTCGYCNSPLGTTEGCPSCAPVAKLKATYERECYAFMVLRMRKEPDGYGYWLESRQKK